MTDHDVNALRGASRLAVEAIQGVTAIVEAMHRTIASGPAVLGRPLARPARAMTAPVYGTIRGITQLVGAGIDAALSELALAFGETAPGPRREAMRAALNGVLGDHLSASGNPLAIPMRLRSAGRELRLERRALRQRLPHAGGKLLVLVHGSSLSDLQWNRQGHDHGAALARELGYTPIYLHYNSGLHVSTNGRALASLLERLVAAWPAPLQELTILAHSMGGLVARSACHVGETEGHRWRRQLQRLVCLGTPHHGSALERVGNWLGVLAGISRYSAPIGRLGRVRSAGVTDMRFGYVLDEHWQGHDRFAPVGDARRELALPAGVDCHAIAATRAPQAAERLSGDGLVSVDSALGRHRQAELHLRFPAARQWIAFGAGHFDLLHRSDVAAKIHSWLAS